MGDRKERDTVLLLDVASHYADYAWVFSAEQANRLPPHRIWNYKIPLKDPQIKVSKSLIYETTWEEDEALRAYLVEYTPLGKVITLRLVAGALILFIRNKDSSLWLCIDYWGLNKSTTLNQYPLPLMNKLREKTCGLQWFTKLDLKNN